MATYSDALVGRALHTRDSRPVGRITAIYRYPETLEAPWGAVAVSAGLLRGSHLVDLEGAERVDGVLKVPHDRRTIAGAPRVSAIGDMLSERDAALLRAYYRGVA